MPPTLRLPFWLYDFKIVDIEEAAKRVEAGGGLCQARSSASRALMRGARSRNCADGGTHLWKTAFPARRPPLSPAASLVRAGGHSAYFAGRLPLHLHARFRDIRCPRLYSLVIGRLFLRRLFRQSPYSPHKRLPRLGAAHGGRGAVRRSYGVVAHFGVLVVRNPRCEPIGSAVNYRQSIDRAGFIGAGK